MLVTLLPFFLAARFPSDDDPYRHTRWQPYGAEVTYDVTMNMTATDIPPKQVCVMISSELRCRPKGSDTLVCRFVNSKMHKTIGDCANPEEMISATDAFLVHEPFEVRFNTRGIENLVVTRTIQRWNLDMIKAIVGQLNVGIEAGDRRRRFNATESSNIGYCEVEISVNQDHWDELAEEESSWEIPEYEIFVESPRHNVNIHSRRSLRIEKTRNPARCPKGSIYFFGNDRLYVAVNKSIHTDVISSVSRIMITKQHFVSETMSEGVVRGEKNMGITRSYQTISLTLKRIQPAREPLPEVVNPASTGIYAYSHSGRFARNVRRLLGVYPKSR